MPIRAIARTKKQAQLSLSLRLKGELAAALEAYVAVAESGDSVQQDLIIDSFLTESIETKHRWIYFCKPARFVRESDRH